MIKFKELRQSLGITQEELRQKFNTKYNRTYTAAAISQFENGKRTPEISALKDFADFFGVSVDCLLGKNTITPNHPNQDIAKILTDNQIEKLEVTKDVSIEDLKELMEFYQKIKINKK